MNKLSLTHKLPPTRPGVTCKVEIGHERFEGYITGNVNEEGRLTEVFLHGWGKAGSSQEGWTQAVAVLLSLALQGGVPLATVVHHLAQMNFPPNGPTNDPKIPHCRSVPDYIMHWLVLRFGTKELREELQVIDKELEPTT